MNLARLKNDWEWLAERDALWAILTDASKASGKWDIAEFMATGEAEIEVVLSHLAKIGFSPDFDGTALDFGCGVGRLTQPLARRFHSCIGVDISRQMIEKAEALNQFVNCQYIVADSEPRLPFPDERFSFIYSNIVLQHVPPRFSEQYLREFVRVLAPKGVLVFGVQESFGTPDIASTITWARMVLRIRSRIRDILGSAQADMQMHCLPERTVRQALGVARVVNVQFTNTAAKDFNGELVYPDQAPESGFVSRQYCVVAREHVESAEKPKSAEEIESHNRAAAVSLFAIKKHDATHLHYDLRLEWNGVLKSWAIREGPSYCTHDKREAVQVEDHSREYAGFEGMIPEICPGAGTVMLWDVGTWEPQPGYFDVDAGLRDGLLRITIHGEKIKGNWTLMRKRGLAGTGRKPKWWLIKEPDGFERAPHEPSVVEEAPNSVKTGRTMEEIARDWVRGKGKNKAQMELS